MGQIQGKVTVIAGATSGIGERTTELFVIGGAKLVIAGRREAEDNETGRCWMERLDLCLFAHVRSDKCGISRPDYRPPEPTQPKSAYSSYGPEAGNGRIEMFAMIRRYEGVGSIDVIALAAKEQFFPLFERLPGFVSYMLVDTGDHAVMSVTIFKTLEQAEAANAAVRDLVQQILSHVVPNPATIVLGKVMAHLDQWP